MQCQIGQSEASLMNDKCRFVYTVLGNALATLFIFIAKLSTLVDQILIIPRVGAKILAIANFDIDS